jgi:AraC-like DNA-binding protein
MNKVQSMSSSSSPSIASDPNEAATLVSAAYFPHELRVLGQIGDFELRLQTRDLGPVTIGALHYGTDVAIDCTYPGSYAINIPLSGRLESSHGGRRITSVRGLATVCPPDRAGTVDLWSADCLGLGLKVDQEYLVERFQKLRDTQGEINLPDQLDLSGPHWHGWVNLLRALTHQSSDGNDLLGGPGVAGQLCGAITDTLIMGLTAANGLTRDDGMPARPRQVTRILDALHASPASNWSLGDMAEVAGVSGRRLQQSFRACLGVSPTEYLRDLRLSLVYRDLMEGPDGELVRDVAAKWGFVHMGRFSSLFKQKYGQLPSTILREQ